MREKSTRLFIACILVFAQYNLVAQYTTHADSSSAQHTIPYQPKKITGKSFIVPVGLITIGALAISGEFVISNPEIKEERDEHYPSFHTNIDDYLQYAPIVAGYAMLVNNPEHSFWTYTKKVVLMEVILNGLVFSTKNITKVPRPDTGAPTSFPSGHTAQAFAGATLFCDEFAQHKPWLCAGMYSTAAVVGALRIMNNRHWAGDIIAGAGCGMLSAKLSELIVHPHKKMNAVNNQF